MNEQLKRMIAAAGISTACLLGVTACGGSSDGPPPGDGLTDMQRQDRDASASISGLVSFSLAMISMLTGENSEPRAIDGITPPVSESAEPAVLP